MQRDHKADQVAHHIRKKWWTEEMIFFCHLVEVYVHCITALEFTTTIYNDFILMWKKISPNLKRLI